MKAVLSLRMAYRHARASLDRAALSIIAVALGVALVTAVRLWNAAVLRSFVDTVDGMAGQAALSITAGPGLTFSEDWVERLKKVDGVRLAVPLVTAVAFPDDGSGEMLTVWGIDLTHDAAVRVYHTTDSSGEVVDDLLAFLNQPDSIIVGREFANARGLQQGDGIDLATPRGVKRFVIRGLLEPTGAARVLRGRLVVMDLYAAERAFATDGQIGQIDILLAAGADLERTRAALMAVLPPELRAEEPALRKDVFRKTIAGFQTMLTGFALLAVLAGFVICFSRLGAIFEARTWEVGLLRAVGLRRAVVFCELLKESLLLGLAGTALGIPLGIVIGRYGLPFAARTTALNFRLPTPAAEMSFSVDVLFLGTLVGLGAATFAAAMPALRMARRHPVAALTMRGRDMPSSAPVIRLGVRLVPVLGVAALVWAQQATRVTALGHVTTGLVALTVCALAGPLVARAARVAPSILRVAFGPTGRFAAAHLGQQVRRASLTVAALGVGLGAVLMFGILSWSFERTLVAQVSARVRADLVVNSAFVSGGYVPAPVEETLVEAARTIPGVQRATGWRRRDITYKRELVALDAYDTNCFHDYRLCDWVLAPGALPNALKPVAKGLGVIVSTSFAHQFGTRVGDTLALESPHGLQAFRVTAVTTAEPTAAVIMSRERYRRTWDDRLVNWVYVAADDRIGASAVRAALERELGELYRLQVRSSAELVEYFASQVRKAFGLQYVAVAITFLLVLIAMGDTLATGVMERMAHLGVMRAVGLRRSRLFAMVMLEGVTIGILGLLLAAAAGLALGAFWVEVQFPAILGWQLDLHFPSTFALVAVAATVLVGAVASLGPAAQAAYLPVPQALRNE